LREQVLQALGAAAITVDAGDVGGVIAVCGASRGLQNGGEVDGPDAELREIVNGTSRRV
jgi:hypothetical protein